MKKDHPKIKKIKKIKQQHNQESHHPQSDHQPNLDTKNTHKIQPKSTSNNPPSHPKTTLLNQQKPIQKQHQNPNPPKPTKPSKTQESSHQKASAHHPKSPTTHPSLPTKGTQNSIQKQPKKHYKKYRHKLPKYLTKQEMKNLISVIKNYRDKILILFLYNTGLRISELVSLEIKHLNFENNTVKVVQGKGGKDRIVNIVDDDLILALKAYIGTRKKGPLFSSNWNKKFTPRGIQKMIKKYAVLAGLQEISRISPHTLRHTFAVHALDSGVNIVTINKQLGHKSLQTTLIYMEISNKMAREDLKKHQPFNLEND